MGIALVLIFGFVFAIAAGIVWAAETGIILVILAIAAIVAVVISVDSSKKMENIASARVVNVEKLIGTRTVQSGYSISTNGHGRVYYRNEKYPAGLMVEFRVTYSDGRMQNYIKARSGTDKYNRLMGYVELTEKRIEREEQERQAQMEAKKAQMQVVQMPKLEEEKPEVKKWYASVPFEIASNEYKLQINNQTCRMERHDDKLGCTINMGISYDGAAKGIRNRKIACAFIDKNDRMVDVRSEWRKLNASGSALISVGFWNDIEDEPKKIIVSIERAD